MSMLLRSAIHAAKRVHSETRISLGNVSVSSLGISKIEQRLGSLQDLSVLVIGAGEMGQAVLKGLRYREDAARVHLISRTFERASQVAERWGAQAHPITHLKDLLLTADVVFATSGASVPILTREDMLPIMDARAGRPLHIVDVAVPRDVAAGVAQIPGVFLDNLDDLQQVIAENHQERQNAIPSARHIIDAELARFWADYQGLDAVPTIQQMRAQADHIRQQELQRIYNKLAGDDAEDLSQLFEEFSHRFMNKMLHQPTQSLRTRAGNGNAALYNSVARDLFGLKDA
jgi:glutamyl-tRNA reductase